MEQRSPTSDNDEDRAREGRRPNIKPDNPGQVLPERIDMGVASLPSNSSTSADAFLSMWENPMDTYFQSLQRQKVPMNPQRHLENDDDSQLKMPASKALADDASSSAPTFTTTTEVATASTSSNQSSEDLQSLKEPKQDDKTKSPKDKSLRPYDIIIGRGRKHENNTGNARFRVTIRLNLKQYLEAPTRQDKTIVILSTYHMLRDDIGARFVKLTEDGQYVPCDERESRDKVAHAFRDLAAQHSKKNKKSKRSSGASSARKQPPSR